MRRCAHGSLGAVALWELRGGQQLPLPAVEPLGYDGGRPSAPPRPRPDAPQKQVEGEGKNRDSRTLSLQAGCCRWRCTR